MANANQNRIVGMLGAKGTGKSYQAEILFRKAPRAIVNDTNWEYKIGYVVSSRAELIKYLKRNRRFRVCFRPLEESDFELLCEVVQAKGNLLLVVEEASTYSGSLHVDPEFRKIISRNRHYGVDLVYTAQRIQDVSKKLTAQTDEFYLFRMVEPRDLDEIEKRFGVDIRDEVERLPDHKFVRIVVGKGEVDELDSVRNLGAGSGSVSGAVSAADHSEVTG